jgi:hypothetical protein
MGPRTDGSDPAPRRALKDIRVQSGRTARQPTFGRIGVGSVLGRTFTVYGKSFLPICLMSLLVYSPLIAYTIWVFRVEDASAVERWNDVRTWASLVLPSILAGPVTYSVVTRLRGGTPGVGDSLRVGFGRIPRIFLTSFVFGLYMFAVLAMGMLVIGIPLDLLSGSLGTPAGKILYAVLLLAAFLWVDSIFWVAIPAAVVEDVGPAEALRRSARLTRRNVGRVFAVVVVLFILDSALDAGMRTLGHDEFESQRLVSFAQTLLAVGVTGPLGAVAGAIAYHDLRTSAEGIDAATIARVFE